MTEEEYWAAIRRVPLYQERDSTDGSAVICRDVNNQPVSVTKPDRLTPDERVAAAAQYKSLYGPSIN